MNLRDLKQEINNIVIEGYQVKTNFSSCDFLVQIGGMNIIAKPICLEKEVKYEFALDVQFLSSKEITYEEIIMIKSIIDLLYKNKKLATSRLKKWTVEEYLEDKRQREIRSIWDAEKEEYYFSVVDVIKALTDSNNPNDYWYRLKKRMTDEEKSEISTKCRQLKLKSKDGKSSPKMQFISKLHILFSLFIVFTFNLFF